jgi:hypothetical protein
MAGVSIERLPLGYVQRSKFTYIDTDTITIGPGVYHHSGTTEQIVYWDSTITKNLTVSGTGFYYIYIDDSAVVTAGTNLLTATELIASPAEPSLAPLGHGWYNGNDRCIFAVFVLSGSVVAFYHDGGDYVQYLSAIADRASSDVAARAVNVLTIPSFSTKAMCYFLVGLNGGYELKVAPSDADGVTILTGVASESRDSVASVITGATQGLYLALTDYTGTNNVRIDTLGWFFPMGM